MSGVKKGKRSVEVMGHSAAAIQQTKFGGMSIFPPPRAFDGMS